MRRSAAHTSYPTHWEGGTPRRGVVWLEAVHKDLLELRGIKGTEHLAESAALMGGPSRRFTTGRLTWVGKDFFDNFA